MGTWEAADLAVSGDSRAGFFSPEMLLHPGRALVVAQGGCAALAGPEGGLLQARTFRTSFDSQTRCSSGEGEGPCSALALQSSSLGCGKPRTSSWTTLIPLVLPAAIRCC